MYNPLMPPSTVLVVDDDEKDRDLLGDMIEALGFEVRRARDGQEALAIQAATPADVIVTDLMMAPVDGFQLLRSLEARSDRTPAIVLTSRGGIEKAISVVHDLKAFWYLEKPVESSVLRALLDRAVAQGRLIDHAELLTRQLSYQGVLDEMVGTSSVMREVFSTISQIAPTSASVMVTGESGTGKELVARAIHRLSPRANGPFIAVNCAAMPETLIESELFGHEKGSFTGALERRAGCFEQAHEGTILLDEIGDMPIVTQAKLLRTLEERKVRRLGGKTDFAVDVRVIAATNRAPLDAIKNKQLREDLYYRLNVFHIELPPLRNRTEDIPAICEALLITLNRKHQARIAGLHPNALSKLQEYAWPGNVRQLRNVLERAVIVAGEGLIMPAHLGSELSNEPPPKIVATDDAAALRFSLGAPMATVEEAYIRYVLENTNNNKTRAAKVLGISVRTLHNRLDEIARRDGDSKNLKAGSA
jgi:DNA-binding NtrC family response regulator